MNHIPTANNGKSCWISDGLSQEIPKPSKLKFDIELLFNMNGRAYAVTKNGSIYRLSFEKAPRKVGSFKP